MKRSINLAPRLTLALALISAAATSAAQTAAAPHRPQGPCDIYAAAGDPCVAAHSTTRALYAAYNGPLYQVLRQSDRKTLDIGVVQQTASDPGGYANAAAQDAFCANTYCWVAILYDQSPKHNDLTQAPRGGFSGPAMGGFNNLPIADMAPITIMGHKAYGLFIAPGMGLRQNDAHGTAVDDQAEGQYWVINGHHYNAGCCFDYGNAETDSRDDGNGTMETTYFGDSTGWYHGPAAGPWAMTDQENNLVGCVNSDRTKLCANLPIVEWRFVIAIAKGEPHHWTSMAGDAQHGPLAVMFNGPRVDATYDPMRKQGAILLGNGGDNSNSSQGTFYEGAMTASGTFPTDATDQLVQANVAAAGYNVPRLSLTSASATANPPGLQTFALGSSQDTAVTFTNTSKSPATNVKLSIAAPKGWTTPAGKTFTEPIAPGATVSTTFKVTSAPTAFNGDLIANASWTDPASKTTLSATTTEKVRNVPPIKINEFSTQSTGSFIELYNAGIASVDLSNWTLTEHAAQQPIFSTVKIPFGTNLAPHAFYLLGLTNSGLAIPARTGDTTIHVRSIAGMTAGDSIAIDTGSSVETRKIASLGTAAMPSTTLWQPVPEGPVITIPIGSTSVPVSSTLGFEVGQKIALGHGATYPAVASGTEQYEVATVTAVGKPGTQAYFGADAPAGSSNLKVTSTTNISIGDKIRLDIDSVGHGIETVTITHVGSPTSRSALSSDTPAGATNIKVRNANGFALGDQLTLGAETVTLTAVSGPNPSGISVDFTPALTHSHPTGEQVLHPGTGLDLAAPLRFNHAANMPFGDRGTGITFQPATAFPHSSNEPVQALGTGITLDSPLAKNHPIDAVVRDAAVTTAGYQGTPAPNQWFGGPALSPGAGSIVLRDAASLVDSPSLVIDSLNYGLLTDPWAAKGYQATSGPGESGCRTTTPITPGGPARPGSPAPVAFRSAGRYPDGADTDSNCTDFLVQAAVNLAAASDTGATNLKVSSVDGFNPGQTVMIDTGANQETAAIATVGTPGATTLDTPVPIGATTIPLANAFAFRPGQTITIDTGANAETAIVASAARRGASSITLTQPLKSAHAASAEVSGSGITLTTPLTHAHTAGAQISDNLPTPGAPNRYSRKPQ
jgi:non-reducing end alpha-L-arabinofuranosidase